jgi:hypothetical protein
MPSLPFTLSTLLCLLIAAANSVLYAQSDVTSSTLTGRIVDVAGSAVAGASVRATNDDRGVVREVTTNEDGLYRIVLLKPGVYSVRVASTGFQPRELKNVVLTVGQTATADIRLEVGQVDEKVDVDSPPPIVETERSQQSDTIERQQISKLPNLSRVFTSYIFTLPGAADVAAARIQQSRVTPIATSGFSFGAAGGRSNYVSIDGGENDSGTGNLRIRNLSVEAVQEFQVNRNSYAAEYGFTSGTAVNVVTRGGTNAFHGSAYVFYRSEKFAARDPLNTTGSKAAEQRVSPGFTLSGPLAKDRTFLFTSFEALHYDIERLRSYTAVHSLFEPTAAQTAYLQTLMSGPLATDTTRAIAARMQAALTTANYPATLQLLQQSEGRFTAPSRAYNSSTRLDHNVGDRDQLEGRFTLALEDNDLARGDNLESPSNRILQKADDYTVVGSWDHIFNDRLINQFRGQFAYDNYRQASAAPQSTNILIAGLISFGRPTTVPLIIKQNRYQFEDTVNWSRGATEIKVGLSYRPVDVNIVTEIGLGGVFQFAGGQPVTRSLSAADAAVLTGPLAPPASTTLTSVQAFNLGIPSSWQQGAGDPGFHAWQQSLGTFAQLLWKPVRGLTLSIGGRLDYFGEPEPLDRNFAISPRVGFAWDPFGKGKTVIRGGFGTFYAPVGLQVLLSSTLQSSSGQYISLQSRTLQDGAQSSDALWRYGVTIGKLPFVALSEADVNAFGIAFGPNQPNRRVVDAAEDYDNPHTVQASLGVSQQLGRDLMLEIGFQMYHGVHLPIALEKNYRESGQLVTVPGMPGSDLFGPRLERIDPTISQKLLHSSEGSSIYYGMTAGLTKRFGERFQFRTSYTYGKALDDVVDFGSGTTPYIPTRRFLERALSAYDLRHNFVASGSYDTPFGRGGSLSWGKRALADITLSPIITLRSGFPFTLYIGRDVNGDLNTPDRPFHAPRNSGIGENFYSVDLRMSKRFYISQIEGARVELVLEATNILNHANFIRVNDVVCGTAAQPGFISGCDPKFLTGPFNFRGVRGLPPTAPLAFVAAATPRQFQLAAKFEF